jgi:hypothetical protein
MTCTDYTYAPAPSAPLVLSRAKKRDVPFRFEMAFRFVPSLPPHTSYAPSRHITFLLVFYLTLFSRHCSLFTPRHTLNFVCKGTPIVCLQLGVLDAFLRPVLVQLADVVLGLLEEEELVADALFNEDTASVLGDDGFLVLWGLKLVCFVREA